MSDRVLAGTEHVCHTSAHSLHRCGWYVSRVLSWLCYFSSFNTGQFGEQTGIANADQNLLVLQPMIWHFCPWDHHPKLSLLQERQTTRDWKKKFCGSQFLQGHSHLWAVSAWQISYPDERSCGLLPTGWFLFYVNMNSLNYYENKKTFLSFWFRQKWTEAI